MIKKTALFTFIVGSISTALIVLDDYLGPNTKFNIPPFTFYMAWVLGFATLVLHIIYTLKNNMKVLAIILILTSLPWVYPLFVLSWYGGISIITHFIIGLVMHAKPNNKTESN